jgi:Flp pilus assembly pilin Flp
MFSFIPKNCRCLLSWSRGFPRRDAAAAAIRVGVAARFMRDQSGAYAVMFGLAAPIVIGALALGSETGLWYSTQAKMQGAADSAAISAAIGVVAGDTNWTLEADATAASNGYLNGSNGTVVTVNNPPKSGPNAGTAGDIEVIIKQPQKLLFSSHRWLSKPVRSAAPTPR